VKKEMQTHICPWPVMSLLVWYGVKMQGLKWTELDFMRDLKLGVFVLKI
jgi:hypothetical protein